MQSMRKTISEGDTTLPGYLPFGSYSECGIEKMLQHRGYVGVVQFSPDEDTFRGKVVNLGREGLTFSGRSVDELRSEFVFTVEEYLAYCASRGLEPEKPFSGKFLIRVSPELHRAISIAAAAADKSLNSWVNEVLEDAAGAV
jgi:predicted HicB family RNase H-like nuclease